MKSLSRLLAVLVLGGILASPLAAQPRKEPNRGGTVDLSTQDPAVAAKRFKLAPGYAINLFASEKEFPELANPVAMTFDARGRLWVATMPTYPQYKPPTPPNDKIIILEDTNGDGKADKVSTFADGLHLPTGLELGNGGQALGTFSASAASDSRLKSVILRIQGRFSAAASITFSRPSMPKLVPHECAFRWLTRADG